jgi:hypothetical protein
LWSSVTAFGNGVSIARRTRSGAHIVLDAVPFTIVSVMPPEFSGLDVDRTFDVVVPMLPKQ